MDILIVIIVFILIYVVCISLLKKQPDNIDKMTGEEFEQYCVKLLRSNGFINISTTRKSGDRGVDIIAFKNKKKYVFQCKRYKNHIGNKAVQEVYSGKKIYKADYAVVLTNNDFTKQAKEDALVLDVKLWGKDKISKLAIKYNKNNSYNTLKPEVKDNEPVVCTMTKIALKDYFTEHNLQIAIVDTIKTAGGFVFETNIDSLKEYENDLIEILGESAKVKYHRIYVDEKDLLKNILGFKQYEPPKEKMYLN